MRNFIIVSSKKQSSHLEMNDEYLIMNNLGRNPFRGVSFL